MNAMPANDTALPTLFGSDEIERLTPGNEIVSSKAPARPVDVDPRHPLERDFPHVMICIMGYWGTEMCAEYIQSLVMMKAGEKRQGFPMNLVEDLLLLDRCNGELLRPSLDR